MDRFRGDRGDRDRDRDRDIRDRERDRDRDRDRDRYGNNPDTQHYGGRRSSRFSDGLPPDNYRRSPSNFRTGFSSGGPAGGGHRPDDIQLRQPPIGADGGFPPMGVGGGRGGDGFGPMGGGAGGGFRPMGDRGGGGEYNSDFQVPLTGQKRGFPFSGRGVSPEHNGGRFVKLFVGSVPKMATEEDIRPLFEAHGKVIEIALIKDKRTGQQQGCCFIKYATSEDADRAIRALHNQYTLPGGIGPIQVRYADGERERLGNVEYKLFVGSLNKQATEKEVEDIFSPFGLVDDVYLMRDERKQSRGCGFVKFSNRDSALSAINSLSGSYIMMGCDQPLTVRFADPKRPRPGESRGSPAFGGPGVAPLPVPGFSGRPAPDTNFTDSMSSQGPPNAWKPMSPHDFGPSSNHDGHGLGNQMHPRSGEQAMSNAGGHVGPLGGAADNLLPAHAVSSSSTAHGYNQSFPRVQSIGQPLQQPFQSTQHFPTAVQPQPQGPTMPGSYSQAQVSHTLGRNFNQLQNPHPGQTAFGHTHPSQQPPGVANQLAAPHLMVQQSVPTNAAQQPPSSSNMQSNVSTLAHPQQLSASAAQVTLQQSPSQLAQMLTQQTQTLQATFQSSQHAFSQLQQQLQMMQPSVQNQQKQWTGGVTNTTGSAPVVTPAADTSKGSAAPAPLSSLVAPSSCNWTEHTAPQGFKYYYNSQTGESRWEKPEEFALYEQQQQKLSVHQSQSLIPQTQTRLQSLPVQGITKQQDQVENRAQFLHSEQQQQMPSSPAATGVASSKNGQEFNYSQTHKATGPGNEAARFQQGLHASQDWRWKNNSGGT